MSWGGLWCWWISNREDIVPLATVIGSMATIIAGSIGLWLLYIRTRAADRTARAALDQVNVAADQAKTAAERHAEQTKADRERRITESFAKAVEQLGSDKLETRLGGIYTLERISRESAREYWPIMETLTAYVREHAHRRPLAESSENALPPLSKVVAYKPLETDIQAILTVLGRRDETRRQQDEAQGRHLDLHSTNLRGAALGGAYLERAILWGVRLENACLAKAHLQGAHFAQAHLEGAVLRKAHLESAHLEGAYLMYTHFEEADLRGADLRAAQCAEAYFAKSNLVGARLDDAELEGAKGLTQEQVDSARGNDKTTLPGLTRPVHWLAARPDEQAG